MNKKRLPIKFLEKKHCLKKVSSEIFSARLMHFSQMKVHFITLITFHIVAEFYCTEILDTERRHSESQLLVVSMRLLFIGKLQNILQVIRLVKCLKKRRKWLPSF